MTVAFLRVFIFSILPPLAAGIHIWADKTAHTRARRLEIILLYLFGVGVAASGLSGSFGHLFLADLVADSIGWPAGNPFQTEVGFANLVLGLLGIVAIGRRDGFREATVMAVTIFGVGATITHLIDMAETGNLAPGNTIQNISNLLRPTLLILFLTLARRAEEEAFPPSWHIPRAQAVGLLAASVGTGFGVGYGIAQPVWGTLAGLLLGAGLIPFTLRGR